MEYPEKANDTHSPATENIGGAKLGREYLALLLRIILIVLIGVLVFTKVFLITRVSGNDMYPALRDGDLIVAFRLNRKYEKNDAVVYTCGDGRLVGRIAALAHDTVMIDEHGILSVNGTEQIGEILFSTYAEKELSYPYTVPDGCVFILNDYRTHGEDSRKTGGVRLENIEGKVITLLRRRGI